MITRDFSCTETHGSLLHQHLDLFFFHPVLITQRMFSSLHNPFSWYIWCLFPKGAIESKGFLHFPHFLLRRNILFPFSFRTSPLVSFTRHHMLMMESAFTSIFREYLSLKYSFIKKSHRNFSISLLSVRGGSCGDDVI